MNHYCMTWTTDGPDASGKLQKWDEATGKWVVIKTKITPVIFTGEIAVLAVVSAADLGV